MKLRALFAALTLSMTLPLQAATEVLQLNYRSADELMPVVQATLGDEGRVSAYGSQLVVNASNEKINELRELLAQLDTAPQRLLISVDSSESGYQDERGYRVDGSARIGDVRVDAGRGERHGQDRVRIIRRNTDSRGGGVQQVQASEGYPALIQVGQSVPLTSSGYGPYGQAYQQTEYRNVTQGFYVTASVSGDTVHVSISSNRDRLSQSHPGVIDIQQADTRVSGRLGEWIPFGGSSEQYSSNHGGFLRDQASQGRSDLSMRLKVEVID
jgi:hypothetical protein